MCRSTSHLPRIPPDAGFCHCKSHPNEIMSDNPSSRRPAPFTLRLTPEERSRLEQDAGHLSLSAYVKSCLFDGTAAPVRTRTRFPVRDQAALSAALARLGQTRIGNNLNQLARAANVGALYLTPELEGELREACSAIVELRALLVAAVGLIDGKSEGP